MSSNVILQPMESKFSREAWIIQCPFPETGLMMCPAKLVFTNASAMPQQSFQTLPYKQELECIQVKMTIKGIFYIVQAIIYKMCNVVAYC